MSFKIKEKRILTHKSGKVVFAMPHGGDVLKPLLDKALMLFHSFKDIPLLPDVVSRLDEELLVQSIHGTAALEDNPLSEKEVQSVLQEHDEVAENIHAMEVRNLKRAYDILRRYQQPEYTGRPVRVDETMIRDIHKKVTQGLPYDRNDPGKYRNHKVLVGDERHGGVYTPPKNLEDIRLLISEFEQWINSDEIYEKSNPIYKAALTHYYTACIHPFADGNGRTARLAEALVMTFGGLKYAPIMLSNYYYKNKDEYYSVFRKAQKNKNNDITCFVEFVFKGVIESLSVVRERVYGFVRFLSLKEYYTQLAEQRKIREREHELLILLLQETRENEASITLGDMFVKNPYRLLYKNLSEATARRDLKHLVELNILIQGGEGYALNLKALD